MHEFRKKRFVLCLYQIIMTLLYRMESIIPATLPAKIDFRLRAGYKLDLRNPSGFNEKIQWIKLNYRDPLYIKCADKYAVREYVEEVGYGNILNTLYGVFDKVEDIDFGLLPKSFAIKGTHGCGMNIICSNKDELDINKTKQTIKKWMRSVTGSYTGEKHYKYIKPRIIAEKFIEGPEGGLPIDYKIYCFNGEPYCIAVFLDRKKGAGEMIKIFFDFNWENMKDITHERFFKYVDRCEKPSNLNEMYNIAKKLSSPFPFVRVDLYNTKGKVVFGELTFTPASGISKAHSENGNLILGGQLRLPPKSKLTWDEVIDK